MYLVDAFEKWEVWGELTTKQSLVSSLVSKPHLWCHPLPQNHIKENAVGRFQQFPRLFHGWCYVFYSEGSKGSGEEIEVFKIPRMFIWINLLLNLSCMVFCGLSETQVSWLLLPRTLGTPPCRPWGGDKGASTLKCATKLEP